MICFLKSAHTFILEVNHDVDEQLAKFLILQFAKILFKSKNMHATSRDLHKRQKVLVFPLANLANKFKINDDQYNFFSSTWRSCI